MRSAERDFPEHENNYIDFNCMSCVLLRDLVFYCINHGLILYTFIQVFT